MSLGTVLISLCKQTDAIPVPDARQARLGGKTTNITVQKAVKAHR